MKRQRLLAVDYGLKRVGVALNHGGLAEPLEVIVNKDEQGIFERVRFLVKKYGVDLVVVGISEGKMAERTRGFARRLERSLDLPVVLFDETLSTKEAEARLIEAGASRKKRKNFLDAAAAAVILEEYLESLGGSSSEVY